MKADFLGLSNMGMIGRALDIIGMTLDDMYVEANPTIYEDPEVIDAFRKNNVNGIFQFGGEATRIVNGDVKPDNFLELCDINALSRPGPLHSGSTADYINIKHGRMEPIHMHPVVDEIAQHTKFCIIYQEQILKLVREVGGFDWVHAQEIRKIISQKHGEAAFNMKEEMFIDGAKRLHGMKRKQAQLIWRRLATAGTYAFNAAHCVSYSMLAYWTMWLKIKHPQAFYAASLAKAGDDKKKRYMLLRAATKDGMVIKAPTAKTVSETWGCPDYRKKGRKAPILAGLRQVPGIGPSKYPQIMADREENGPFNEWKDLQRIRGIGPKTTQKMSDFMAGEDPFGIYHVDKVLGRVREAIEAGELGILPTPTHRGLDIPTDATNLRVIYLGIPNFRNPQDVVEDERARTGKDYAEIIANMDRPDLVKKMAMQCYDDTDKTVYLRFSRYKFPMFEKGLWSIDLDHDVVLIIGKKRGGFGTSIHVENMWVIDPDTLMPEEEEIA
jgi:DNA polymerase-3 subunit alpha